MLGKAPGTELLNEWYGVYNASVDKGMSPEMALLEVANHIAASSAFTSMYPFFITNAEFARDFLTAALGEAPSAEVLALATGLLNGGLGRGEMGLLAVRQLFEIRMQGESHPAYGDFGALAMMFANKVQVATYYTVEKRWEGASSSVLGGVTGDGDSVDTAKEAIDMMRRPGKSFELTTGVDRLDGTLGDDTFVATEKTLTGVDRLDGGEGMDTLELSSSGSDDNVSVSSGASVMNVETLTVDSGGDFEADLSGWEGLKEVVLSDVEGDVELDAGGADIMSKSLGDDDKDTTVEIMNAAAVKLEGVSKMADVGLYDTDTTTSIMVEGGKTVDVGKEDAPSATVESVTLDDVHDGLGTPDKRGKFKTDDKIDGTTVTADQITASADTVPVHIYSTAITDISLANTNTTLLVQNDVKGDDPTSLTAMVDKFGLYSTASEHGKLCLKGIEDLAIEVKGDSNIRLASDEIETVSVSGAGNLMLDATKFKPAVNPTEADPIVISATLKSIDASEATGDVKVSRLGKSVESYMGGSGKDDVAATEFHKDGLKAELGEGDDMFTIGAGVVVSARSRVDGGAGEDTLTLTANKASQLKNVDDDVFMNFEKTTLTVEADKSAAAGKYDLEELMLHKLTVTKGVTSGTAPAIKFENVGESASGLAIEAKRSSSSDEYYFDVSYMLEKDADDAETSLVLKSYGVAADGAGTTVSGEKVPFNKDVVISTADPTRNKELDPSTITHLGLTSTKLVLDEDIEELTMDSSVVVGKSDLKASHYLHEISHLEGEGLETLTITGNAGFYLSGNGGGETSGKTSDLDMIDARDNTGGLSLRTGNTFGDSEAPTYGSDGVTFENDMEIHGSDGGGDIIVYNGGGDDKLWGYGGDDIIAGGKGKDRIAGGAGGDELTGGVFHPARESDGTESERDTFVYEKASDSQVAFTGSNADNPTGMDVIFNFVSSGGSGSTLKPYADKIDLSALDLAIKVGGKEIKHITHNNNLSNYLYENEAKAKGVFKAVNDKGGHTFGQHTIVAIKTKEDTYVDNQIGISRGSHEQFAHFLWILVDINGNGDFDKETDMAIGLAGRTEEEIDGYMLNNDGSLKPGSLTADDFIL